MTTTPTVLYARRLQGALARLGEAVTLSRPATGGPERLAIRPLVVPATASVETAVSDGGAAMPTAAEQFAGFAAQAKAGESLAVPDSLTSATKKTVVPVLLVVQDVSQPPAAVGDTFARDGQTWTVRSVTNQVVAGLVIAVLSLADTG